MTDDATGDGDGDECDDVIEAALVGESGELMVRPVMIASCCPIAMNSNRSALSIVLWMRSSFAVADGDVNDFVASDLFEGLNNWFKIKLFIIRRT